ncbi:HrpE family protein [Xanthomonas translucens]|uniref:HrpE family protein n=1 Tax=Xanthomonas campestris pv. translucens TaxID=343 RepID=UPI001F3143E7|nr:HrpE family protein [Xanthomonas translucens]
MYPLFGPNRPAKIRAAGAAGTHAKACSLNSDNFEEKKLMALPFSALANAGSASTAFGSFRNGLAGLSISGASGMANNTIGAGQMGSMVGNMRTDVSNQEAMMDQVTQMQNELNMHMAMCQLSKQAGANAKSLTQG